MPKIPIFTATGRVERYNPPMQDPSAMGAPGRALSEVGAQVAQIGLGFLEKYDQAQRQSEASNAIAGATRELSDLEIETSKIPNGKNARAAFDAGAEKIKAKTLANVPRGDIAVQNIVQSRIDTDILARSESTFSNAFKLESSAEIAKMNANLQTYEFQASTNPAVAPIMNDNALAEIAARERAGWITPVDAQKLRDDFHSNVQYGTARHVMNDALITDDAHLAAAKAKNIVDFYTAHPEELDAIPAPQREALMSYLADGSITLKNAAEREDREAQAIAQGQLRSKLEDDQASLSLKGVPVWGVTNAQIRAAFPEDADRIIDNRRLAFAGFQFRQKMALQSQDQDVAGIKALDPSGPNFAAKAKEQQLAVQEYDRKWQDVNKDPSAYVRSVSPEISAAFDKAAKDPALLKPALAMQDGAYDRLGLPRELRTVMPEAQAVRTVSSIMADPANAPQAMAELQIQYGDKWPSAFHDLTVHGKLPAPFQAVPTLVMKDPDGRPVVTRDAVLLAHWVADLRGKSAVDLIGNDAMKAIDNTVETDTSVQAYIASLSLQGLPSSQIIGIADSIKALGYSYVFYDHQDAATAAKTAVQNFAGKFQYLDPGKARVPLDVYANVSRAAAVTLDRLTLDDITVPPLYTGGAMLSKGVRPDGLIPGREGNLDASKAGDNWATFEVSEDGIPLHLVLPTQPGDDNKADDATGRMGDAVERYRKTGKYYGAFDSDEAGANYVKRAQGMGGGLGPAPQDYIDSVRYHSIWIVNPRADGLWLMDAGGRYVQDKTGKNLEIPFNVTPPPYADPFEAMKGSGVVIP